MYVHSSGAVLFMTQCVFYNCSSTSQTGGMHIQNGKLAIVNSTCFKDCKSPTINSFEIWGAAEYCLEKGYMEFISDFSPYETFICSVVYNSSPFTLKNTNVTNSFSSSYTAGIEIGCSKSVILMSYSQISNSIGKTFFGSLSPAANVNQHIITVNMINTSAHSACIGIRHNSVTLSFYYCYVSNLKSLPMLYLWSITGSISFDSCFFDIPYQNSIHSEINTINNVFSHVTYNKLSLIDPRTCDELLYGPITFTNSALSRNFQPVFLMQLINV